MKILIADIPDEGLYLDIEEKINIENVSLLSPASAHLELNKAGGEIIINGGFKTEIGLQCSRCLKDFRRNMDIPVNVIYHPIEEIGMERHELKGEEMDMGFYRGEELDLQELLREQLMLNIQMKPLCDEACKGICPKCGADLNHEQCDCKIKEIDPRLEVLKKYPGNRKE